MNFMKSSGIREFREFGEFRNTPLGTPYKGLSAMNNPHFWFPALHRTILLLHPPMIAS